jgi:Ni,Fe-hydrogenase III large subunit
MSDVPRLTLEALLEELASRVAEGARVIHYFGYKSGPRPRIMAVLGMDGELLAAWADADDLYQSLTQRAPAFHMFERELAEQFGARPLRHPWLKSVRYHPNWLGVPDVFNADYSEDIPGGYPFYRVEGDGVHEVGVGPVHAGIIEPGHFRFQCVGEKTLSLEIQLGYQHRDAERLLTQVSGARRAIVAEGLAGDTAIGNSLCHSQAMEALCGLPPMSEAIMWRSAALELERLSNHVGDLGSLSGDVAFYPPAAYFGGMRGEFLNLLMEMSGNRFGKGFVRPGGIYFRAGAKQKETILKKIQETRPQLEDVASLLLEAPSVLARFEGAGKVDRETALALGLVGPPARASGVDYDVRAQYPNEGYLCIRAAMATATSGDVLARAAIRRAEIIASLDFIEKALASAPEAPPVEWDGHRKPAANMMTVTMNEAWRGELSHLVITGHEGEIVRYKVKDPSFHNWAGLAMAMRGEGISDFPLINKSFNLSYCGFDL